MTQTSISATLQAAIDAAMAKFEATKTAALTRALEGTEEERVALLRHLAIIRQQESSGTKPIGEGDDEVTAARTAVEDHIRNRAADFQVSVEAAALVMSEEIAAAVEANVRASIDDELAKEPA